MRTCKTCGESKPLTSEFFHPQNGYKDGFVPHCKVCRNAVLAAHKTKVRRERGSRPRRVPYLVAGCQFWECLTPGCGYHPRGDFYNARGPNKAPRPLCKRCHSRITSARLRQPAVKAGVAERAKKREFDRDPERVGAKRQRMAQRELCHEQGVRPCPGCQGIFVFAEFQPTAKRPKGSKARCQECRNAQASAYARQSRKRDPGPNRMRNAQRKAVIRGAEVCDLTMAQ
jgi:hypothetical protein